MLKSHDLDRVLTQIGNAELLVTAVVALASVVAYHIKTKGQWRHREASAHIFWFMTACSSVLIVAVLRVVLLVFVDDEPTWFHLVRVLLFGTIPLVFGWRLAIILGSSRWRTHQDPEKEKISE